MKTINLRAFVLVLLTLAWASVASAQQYTVSNTTLNGAITATQTTLVLTSAVASSGSSFGAPAAGQCLFVDGELMRIVSMSSTTATVTRSFGAGSGPGTQASAHPSGAIVWTGPCNQAFKQSDPPVPSFGNAAGNSCSSQPAPWINVSTGNIWWCNRNNNRWSGTNYKPLTYNSVPTAQ